MLVANRGKLNAIATSNDYANALTQHGGHRCLVALHYKYHPTNNSMQHSTYTSAKLQYSAQMQSSETACNSTLAHGKGHCWTQYTSTQYWQPQHSSTASPRKQHLQKQHACNHGACNAVDYLGDSYKSSFSYA